jgi:EEF1A N-terminal glycine/lysine methyltransferase
LKVSLTVARCGAKNITITDYPSPALISTIRTNVQKNLKPPHEFPPVSIEPYKWGDTETQLGQYTRVIASDCLWKSHEHENLVKSMLHFLCSDEAQRAKVWVAAGFHTGRAVVRDFFDIAGRGGLAAERIWERNSKSGEEREWAGERDGEGFGERKVWCVMAILRRAGGG